MLARGEIPLRSHPRILCNLTKKATIFFFFFPPKSPEILGELFFTVFHFLEFSKLILNL